MQLRLDLQYPKLGLDQRLLQFVGIHRRPCLLTFQQLGCLTCWPPSPCDRLSRSPRRVVTPATTTRPPPHPSVTGRDGPAETGLSGGGARSQHWNGSHVHHAIDRSVSVALGSTPAASPRLRRRPSSWPPQPTELDGFGVPTPPLGVECTADRPTSTRFEHGFAITGLLAPIHSRCTF